MIGVRACRMFAAAFCTCLQIWMTGMSQVLTALRCQYSRNLILINRFGLLLYYVSTTQEDMDAMAYAIRDGHPITDERRPML